MFGTKLILFIISTFLFVFGSYLLITNRTIEGTFLMRNSGWVHSSLSGYYLIVIAIGLFITLYFISKGRKIKL
jgi:hypothetical protein